MNEQIFYFYDSGQVLSRGFKKLEFSQLAENSLFFLELIDLSWKAPRKVWNFQLIENLLVLKQLKTLPKFFENVSFYRNPWALGCPLKNQNGWSSDTL